MAARYQEELERKEFYLIDTKIEQVVAGLGLTAIGLDRPIEQMSGGQRAKVILAKLLLEKPDIFAFGRAYKLFGYRAHSLAYRIPQF